MNDFKAKGLDKETLFSEIESLAIFDKGKTDGRLWPPWCEADFLAPRFVAFSAFSW